MLVACQGPPVKALADAEPGKVFPDGRVCAGHDEDRDGFPDECDDCPGVANADQHLGEREVGDACVTLDPFEAKTRLFFDAFVVLDDWSPLPATASFSPTSEDRVSGGTVGGDFAAIVKNRAGAGRSTVVATTVLAVEEGGSPAGVLVRVGGDPPRFLACEYLQSFGGFAVAHASPTPTGPGPNTELLKVEGDAGTLTVSAKVPTTVPHSPGQPIGLRASVIQGDQGGVFECRVFDPLDRATLLSGASEYQLRVDVPASDWLAEGEVGLYAQGSRAVFSWIDVLRGP